MNGRLIGVGSHGLLKIEDEPTKRGGRAMRDGARVNIR